MARVGKMTPNGIMVRSCCGFVGHIFSAVTGVFGSSGCDRGVWICCLSGVCIKVGDQLVLSNISISYAAVTCLK